jgi:hypothetical protein
MYVFCCSSSEEQMTWIKSIVGFAFGNITPMARTFSAVRSDKEPLQLQPPKAPERIVDLITL